LARVFVLTQVVPPSFDSLTSLCSPEPMYLEMTSRFVAGTKTKSVPAKAILI